MTPEQMPQIQPDAHITVRDLTMAYGDFVIQHDLNFTVHRGDIFIIMGGSGCGKSTLLRHLVGLKSPAKGQVYFDSLSFWEAGQEEQETVKRSFGMLFQSGALWSSLTLAENIALPLGEYTELSPAEIGEIVSLKLALVGLAGFEEFYRAPWRSIPISCSLTNLRPAWIPSAHAGSMSSYWNCAKAWVRRLSW
jgi:phospholipid/cholesterol/gamma-HCH transport system ATP-binding protein